MDYNQMNILKKDFKQTTLCEPLVSKINDIFNTVMTCMHVWIKKKNHSTV